MYRKEKKISTIFALMLIILGIGSIAYLDKRINSVVSQAGNNVKFENIRVSNITDNSFVVSFLSNQALSGIIEVTGENLKKTLFDDLDPDNIPRKRTIHYITVSNLSENNSYQIKILDGSSNCISCPVINQKTATKLKFPLELPPIVGKTFLLEGKPAVGAIVFFTVGDSLPITVRTDTAGLYAVPLNNLWAENLIERPKLNDSDLVQIEIISSPNLKSSGVIDFKAIRLNPNIPDMKMGEKYNFLELLSKKDTLAVSQNSRILGTNTIVIISPTIVEKTNKNMSQTVNKIDLLFPKEDKDLTPDNKPSLRGVGIPGSPLTITINSSPQTAQIIVGDDGKWSFRPPKPLEAGIHTITIQGTDNNGKLITLKRSFTVLKSGERVLGESTSSATLTPTIAKTPTPTILNITPALIPSVAPTIIPTATILPTNTLAPIPTNSQTDAPITGDIKPLLMIGGVSAILLMLGIKFFFFL